MAVFSWSHYFVPQVRPRGRLVSRSPTAFYSNESNTSVHVHIRAISLHRMYQRGYNNYICKDAITLYFVKWIGEERFLIEKSSFVKREFAVKLYFLY